MSDSFAFSHGAYREIACAQLPRSAMIAKNEKDKIPLLTINPALFFFSLFQITGRFFQVNRKNFGVQESLGSKAAGLEM